MVRRRRGKTGIRAAAIGAVLALVPAAAAAGPPGRQPATAPPVHAPVTVYPSRDGAVDAWRQGFTGTGVGIAIVDSGVTPGPDFGSRLVQVRLPGQTGSLDDLLGHGTLVAGIAAGSSPDGRYVGVAPGSTIYALNVYRADGVVSGDVIEALQWVFVNARADNIRVVNLSLSEVSAGSYRQSALDLAVERLWAEGVLVVTSAGNSGPAPVNAAPANDPLALTVGAFDDEGTIGPADDTIASFTPAGSTADGFAKPELLAPGVGIVSTLPAGTILAGQAPADDLVAPAYAKVNGTSFAAPQVAGAAAIAFQTHPSWSPDEVKWLLLSHSGPSVRGTDTSSLSLHAVASYSGQPGYANQGVPSLVCAPQSTCTTDGTIASSWTSNSWNADSWTSNSWNVAAWNSNSWNTAGWTADGWASNSWNAAGWESIAWG
jgi:serine protease AprX